MPDPSPLVKALSSGDVNAAMPEAYMNPDVGPGGSIARMIQGLMTLPQRAIQNSQYSLDSGTYDPQVPLETAMTLTGGAGVVPAEANSLRMGIKAYHGSPHDFDRFSMDKIGTGEGAQAYGHGLYFADNEGIAKGYRNKLSDTPSSAKFYLDRADGDPSKAAQQYWADVIRGPNMSAAEMEEAKRMADVIQRGGAGRLYKVDINADPAQMLDWDKPLQGQGIYERVHPAVRGAIDEAMDNRMMNPMSDALEAYTGRDLHNALRHEDVHETLPAEIGNSSWYTGNTTEKRHTAEYLKSLDVPGIKYLDQGSRGAGQGSSNYVVFNDKLIDILKKYGIGGAVPASAAGFGTLAQQGRNQGT